jgi:hypothetical protein
MTLSGIAVLLLWSLGFSLAAYGEAKTSRYGKAEAPHRPGPRPGN